MHEALPGRQILAVAQDDERFVNAGTNAVTATLPQQPNGSAAVPIAPASASAPPAVGQDTVMADAPASTAAMAAVAPAAPASAPAASQEEQMPQAPQAPPPRAPSITPEERAEIPVRQMVYTQTPMGTFICAKATRRVVPVHWVPDPPAQKCMQDRHQLTHIRSVARMGYTLDEGVALSCRS